MSTIQCVLVRHDGAKFTFDDEGATIGRSSKNQIALSDPSVSRFHATLLVAQERCWVRDERSAGGTFINDRQIAGQQEIREGDILRVGNYNFRFGILKSAQSSRKTSPVLIAGVFGVLALLFAIAGGVFGDRNGGGIPSSGLSPTQSGPHVTVSDDLIISDQAEVITAADQENISNITDEGTIVFEETSTDLENVEAGDVIVGGISAAAPDGFILRVVSVTEIDGRVEVETTQASLEDIIERGTISMNYPITPEDVVSYTGKGHGVKLASVIDPAQSRPALFLDITNVAGNMTYIEGSVKFTPDLDFEVRYDDGLQYAKIQLVADEQANLTIKSTEFGLGVGALVEITRIQLKRFTFSVGPVPVVVQPILLVTAGFEGNVQIGLEHKIVQTGRFTAGLEYDQGEFRTYKDHEINYEYSQPGAFVESEVKGFAGPELFLKFYGITGPYIATHFTVRVKAHAGLDAYVSVDAGTEVKAGLKLEIDILALKIILRGDYVIFSRLMEVYRHDFVITPTFRPTVTDTPEPTIAFTPTPEQPYLIIDMNANCRTGPSQVYDSIVILYPRDKAVISGKSPTDGWWYVQPLGGGQKCWVWGGAGQGYGNPDDVPVIQPPPPPTPKSGIGDVSVSQRNITISIRDSAEIDGDRITIKVNGVVVLENYTITGSYKNVNVLLNPGENVVTVKALNEGSMSPNTVEVKVSHVVYGNPIQVSGGLYTNQVETFTIYSP